MKTAAVKKPAGQENDPAADAGTLIRFGGAVKALGCGRFEGPLITFGDAETTDLADDFFVAETKFWKDWPATVPLLYAHGMDDALDDRELGVKSAPGARLELRDAGVWMQGQLDLADDYEAAIYALVEAGKMGSSSGSATHLVKRLPVVAADGSTSYKITSWPLVEASLTPQPCESRNRIAPLKSLPSLLGLRPAAEGAGTLKAPSARAGDVKAVLLGEDIEGEMGMAALGRLNDALMYRVVRVVLDPDGDPYDARLLGALGLDEDTPLPARVALLRAAFDEFRDLAVAVVESVLGGSASEDAGAAIKSLEALWGDPDAPAPPVGAAYLRQAEQTHASVQALAARTQAIAGLRVKSGRVLSRATRERLQAHVDGLTAVTKDMADLLHRSAAPAADAQDSHPDFFLQSLLNESRGLGVTV